MTHDIKKLSKAELGDADDLLADRLPFLSQMRTKARMAHLKLGDRVEFLSRRGLRRRYQEGACYLASLTRAVPVHQARLLIFGQGRTGSTLLESLLASTGHFRPYGELLDIRNGEIRYPLPFIRGLSKRNAGEGFSFHLKVYQLSHDRKRPVDPAAFVTALYDEGWNIIYLRRRNKVKHAISNIVAKHRGAYHRFSDDEEPFQVHVDCEDFVQRVSNRVRFEEAEKAALAAVRYHEVVYEEDLQRPHVHQPTVDRILDYLSLERRAVATPHKKVYTQSPDKLIANFDEFVACLEKQGWRELLED